MRSDIKAEAATQSQHYAVHCVRTPTFEDVKSTARMVHGCKSTECTHDRANNPTKSERQFCWDDEVETTAKLTDVEITAEVTCEWDPKKASTPDPSSAKNLALLRTLGKGMAAVAFLCRYCSAIACSKLALVDSYFNTVE